MDEKVKKTSEEKSNAKKICLIVIAIVIVLVAIISIGIYNSGANQLQKHLDLGQRYLDEMEYEQAIAAFELAIAIDPKCGDAYLGMAEAYAGLGQYEDSLKNYDILLGLNERNRQALKGLSDCLREYIDVLLGRELYDEITNLAEKYGNQAVNVDFQIILGEVLDTGEGEKEREPEQEEQEQVTIKKTDIKVDSVFNTEGYGSLQIQSVGEMWIVTDDGWFPNDAFLLPQAALVDADGNMVFPYQYTYQRYYVSDDIVSLTEGSPYSYSCDQEGNINPPIYCRLDGSIVFDTTRVDNQVDEKFVWYGSPVLDGYGLVIKSKWGMLVNGVQSYIMDRTGMITCVLPDEYNEIEGFGEGLSDGGFDTTYSLGWCGEGLFAVFENRYDENWNYSREAKGYLDPAGNMVIDLSGRGFINLWPFHEGLAAVQSESGMIGFIDKTGALVIPCVYDAADTSFSKDGICGVKKDGKWGYIDRDGNVVIPFEYDNAYGAGDGLASVVKDGKCGLVDYSNQAIVPLEYDDISSCERGVAYAIKAGVLYIISK